VDDNVASRLHGLLGWGHEREG
jgi:hypothetical protein